MVGLCVLTEMRKKKNAVNDTGHTIAIFFYFGGV